MPSAGPYRDHRDRPTPRPAPPDADRPAFYAPIGDLQGRDYRRNAFARGTEHEVEVLRDRLGLREGDLVLDVGCGDGRHLRRLARDGVAGVGLDVSQGLLRAAVESHQAEPQRGAAAAGPVSFVRADARRPPLRDGVFDAALCLCHGGLGTHPRTDRDVLAGMVRATRPGGHVAFTLFHALFAARHLVPGDAFDPYELVHHQVSEVRGPEERREDFDLWTVTYTARDARSLAEDAGLEVLAIVGCEPGRYDAEDLRLDDPELLVVARRARRPASQVHPAP